MAHTINHPHHCCSPPPTNSIQALILSTIIAKKAALLLGLWSSVTTLQYVKWSISMCSLSNDTTCIIDSCSPPTKDSPMSMEFFPLRFLISINPQISSAMVSMEPPFFLFPLDWDSSVGHFLGRLRLCPSPGVGNSSTSFTLSTSTLTCTPDDRKVAYNSHSLELFGASRANDI